MNCMPVRYSGQFRTIHSLLMILGAFTLIASGCGEVDNELPTITASVSPAANAAGWHNEDAIVTFVCSDAMSGIATCPGPVLVSTEGENQVISGTAVDRAGNTAGVSLTVNLDKTAPALSDYLPSDGDTLLDPEVNLTGKVDDVLSGLAAVNCDANGTSAEAVISEEQVEDDYVFACSMPLDPGSQVITVEGSDIAGNVASSSLTIYYTPPPNIAIVSPNDGKFHLSSTIVVEGTIDDTSATVTVNDVPASIADGLFSATVPLENGFNTITALAQNDAGSSSASVRILAIVGLVPTVRILSPQPAFVLGQLSVETGNENYPVTVRGWVRDNRLLGIGDAPVVTVGFNSNTPVPAEVTQNTSGLCQSGTRCWTYSATDYIDEPMQLSIDVEVQTGDLTASRGRSGLVDFCYQNNGGNNSAEACAASLFQEEQEYLQSRRCIQNSDGCSAPLGPLRNNPTLGFRGLSSTAFGMDEDAGSPEAAFTVFGQPRLIQLPCNRHDECYHQWGPSEPTRVGVVAEKTRCNLRFLQDMQAVCRQAYPELVCPAARIGLLNCPAWRREKTRCYAWARIYFDAVQLDTSRYFFLGPYDDWPYGGFLTPCEDCPEIQ